MAKIIDNYILLEHICQGTFGEIHRGRNLISKEAVAVKTVLLESFLNDSVLRDMIINEIQALKKLDDPHIVRMIKMLKSSNNIYLIYEFLQGRNLKKLLNERHHLSQEEGMEIFKQVCKGFERLQAEKIIKKNLNSLNIHIIEHQQEDSEGQEGQEGRKGQEGGGNQFNYEVKLKHFFICKSASSNTSSRKFEQFLFHQFHYVAPELLINAQQQINQQQQLASNGSVRASSGTPLIQETVCDVFSAGVVLYEMLIGCLPFEKYANTKEDLLDFYSNNDISDVISEDVSHLSTTIQQLLRRMIVVESEDRITWEQVFLILNQYFTQNTTTNTNTIPSPLKDQSIKNIQNNPNPNNINVDYHFGEQEIIKKHQQHGSGQQLQSQKSNLNLNNDTDKDQEEGEQNAYTQLARNNDVSSQNQKSNTKHQSNANNQNNNSNNSIGQIAEIAIGNINLSSNSSQKLKYRNNSEQAQQQNNIQDNPNCPPVANVKLSSNKIAQATASGSNTQKEQTFNPANGFYASVNSKLNKENTTNRIHEFSSSQVNRKDLSTDLSSNTLSGQYTNNVYNDNSGDKRNKEAINLILDEIMDKRSKIQVILGALDNCMDQDDWNVTALNAYSCGFILLKKACGLSEYLIQIFENSEKVLAHLNLNSSQLQAWQISQKKQQLKQNIMRENLELKSNLMKFQDDFSESIEIRSNGVNVYNLSRRSNENSQIKDDMIINDELLNSLLFSTSKEMSSISNQTKNRKSLILAHFLADIACIDIMYNKFLGKKRLDVLNHPYFKKLTEISREKLQENLDNKFKLYDYHRTCSEM